MYLKRIRHNPGVGILAIIMDARQSPVRFLYVGGTEELLQAIR